MEIRTTDELRGCPIGNSEINRNPVADSGPDIESWSLREPTYCSFETGLFRPCSHGARWRVCCSLHFHAFCWNFGNFYNQLVFEYWPQYFVSGHSQIRVYRENKTRKRIS